MHKKKICITITTRGNYAKMKSVIAAIQDRTDMELQMVLAGGALLPRYGNVSNFLDPSIPVMRQIPFLIEGETLVSMAKSSGLVALEFATLYAELKPDVAIIIADRYECLPMAMSAAYLNIPVAHIEGGEVTGSIDESIRHAITKLAHVHFPATQEAAERIVRMGEAPETVHVVGATSLDVIAACDLENIQPVQEIQNHQGVGSVIDLSKSYIVVSQHSVTTEYEASRVQLNVTLAAVHEGGYQAIWIWPNMDAGSDGVSAAIRSFRESTKNDNIHYFKSLPIEIFAPLVKNATCIVGNSSCGIREAGFLGTPCVNIGTRQNGRARSANVCDVPHEKHAIRRAIDAQIAHGPYAQSTLYGDGKSGKRIVDILGKFTGSTQKQITY